MTTILKRFFIKADLKYFLGFSVVLYANHLLAAYYFSGKWTFNMGMLIFILSLSCLISAQAKTRAAKKE